jgi:hypothetical protein
MPIRQSAQWSFMFGLDSVDSIAHVIEVALTPIFLLSGIASLLGVLSTRLGRVADRVDSLTERLEAAEPVERNRLQVRQAHPGRRRLPRDGSLRRRDRPGDRADAGARRGNRRRSGQRRRRRRARLSSRLAHDQRELLARAMTLVAESDSEEA